MSDKNHRRLDRAASLPPQQLNSPRPQKVTHTMASHTQPGEITRRRSSTSSGVTAHYQTKTQVNSKIMELKFGMSPFKTQQFSVDSVIPRKKSEQIKKEPGKTGLGPSFGRWSFRMPKKNGDTNSISESLKNKFQNTQFSSQLYDKNINVIHKVKDWVNEDQRTPQAPLRRSVSDLREISSVPAFALILAERQESRVGTLLKRKCQEAGCKDIEGEKLTIVLRKHRGVTGEAPLNISMKTKIGETQPKDLLGRSLPDLKQKSIAARNFLNLSEVKENACRSVVIQTVDDNSNNLSDNDENDICDNKENIVIDAIKEKDTNVTDQSRQYGSILKRPGIKRMNIKHVEFLDNIGDDEDNRVRYF